MEYILIGILVAIPFFFWLFMIRDLGIWLQAFLSDVYVSLGTVVGMRLRKVDSKIVVGNYIKLKKAGLDIPVKELEAHYLAGGDVDRVAESLIASRMSGNNRTFGEVCAMDLARNNPLGA